MADLKEANLFHSLRHQQGHWYYHAKIAAVNEALAAFKHLLPGGSRTLDAMDIGAGNGIISRSITEDPWGSAIQWSLVDTGYADQELCEAKKGYSFHRHPPEGECFDLILAIDVVEHVPHDADFLADLASRLRPGGLLVATVPAFQFLWSGHDVALGHCRRYRRSGLTRLMQSAGLRSLASGYLYSLLFPLLCLSRCLRPRLSPRSDLSLCPDPINRALIGLMALERCLHRWLPLSSRFPGLSVMAVVMRPRVGASGHLLTRVDEEDQPR